MKISKVYFFTLMTTEGHEKQLKADNLDLSCNVAHTLSNLYTVTGVIIF